uniref:Protein IQ-DOMAIN 32 n=1 Tax=Cajanus cajan TaxID=3821 RepID=A0A151QRL9_CAJCA|nr:Protein IQ-DOMAIN 32 [Cajanus cajan]
MGKSTSCFKLITCGGDAAENDDYHQVSEIKESNDKRGWSFRKKSARHRVLSNTVIAEAPSSANKESSECANFNFQPLPEPNVVDKIYTTNCSGEKPQLSSFESSQVAATNVIETEKVNVNPPESDVIIIQAAIRGLLAQRELLQLKKVVKLQAAVRGHLVRRHAVGTLRCVQAIIKMQVLVRARHARQSRLENHLNHKDGERDSSKALGNENHVTKSNVNYTSIEKLLSNKFACQLLESTPKSKAIHVKCDPSKADSAWKWLERWMSVSSKDIAECKETKHNSLPVEPEISPPVEHSSLHEGPEIAPLSEHNSLHKGPEIAPPPELNSFHQKPEIDNSEQQQSKRSMKRFASDPLEAEGKKAVNGSRKVSNPAFIAAQSKFEELSSIANSGRTNSLSYQDSAVESQGDTASVGTDTAYRSKEFAFENPASYLSRFAGSECGTELSISSTLDSPDISEPGAMENERDAKDLVEGIGNLENTINRDDEANVSSAIPASNLSTSVLDQSEIVNDINGNLGQSVVAVDSEEPAIKTEKNASDLQREQAKAVLQDLRSSPEASPRSHLTVPESQGTPSSQVSVKPKESKTNKTRSGNKRRSLSLSNKSPTTPNHDSGSRGSREQLPKDQQNGKRRNSFGSVKPDNIDQEPRDNSTGNNSIPHFMQATESARAKINANNSPRSSPDVHERDIEVKKRHSLPGATGRQGSPRIQRSTSKAQQSAKGNNVHPPQERKWLR